MAVKEIGWGVIKKAAQRAVSEYSELHAERLEFEIEEVEKQGASRYWEDIINEKKKFGENPKGLLLPWLLGRLSGAADCDPLVDRTDPLILSTKHKYITEIVKKLGRLPVGVIQDDDKPDIDIDCLPDARDKIKEYAAQRYGSSNVASVGTWQTYLFKQAIGDTYFAYYGREDDVSRRGTGEKSPAIQLTRDLPEDVNEMLYGGIGACKGKMQDENGERECGHKYNGLAGEGVAFLSDNDVPSESWFKLKCPVCGSGDTDTPTLGALMKENEELLEFAKSYPSVIDMAVRLVGRVRNAGKHAGAIIIADRDLFGNVPMTLDQKSGQWVSIWTEGHNTQLSKFGYNKWDILGLKNLEYIYECCKMVEINHGITFRPPDGGSDMDGLLRYVDPEIDQAGVYWDADGNEVKITLNDEAALQLANDLKTDAIFQFDTDLAKRTLANGVRTFWDLLIFNAMGHPGPMAMIPEYVKRRDDPSHSWQDKEHPKVIEVLGDTQGVIVFQEQLTGLWQNIAGFTGPESQDARKAVAKKWKEKLKPVRQKWIDGATKDMGESLAVEWWDERMESFGRYAFNKSHSVSYCLWAYKCLWLKAHFPEEWWACVMSDCHQDKIPRYMSAARVDGVKFGLVNINHMTVKMTAHAGKNAVGGCDTVSLGLISFKKVGDKMAPSFADAIDAPQNSYDDIDEFIEAKSKNKILLERLIKLGAFSYTHQSIKATWMWYVHKYCTGDIKIEWEDEWEDSPFVVSQELDPKSAFVADPMKPKKWKIRGKDADGYSPITVARLKEHHRKRSLEADGWNDETIAAERKRQIAVFEDQFPKRKVPKKVFEWKPKADESRDRIMSFYPDDYDLRQILKFELEFLGYYWHSPLDAYRADSFHTAEHAKDNGVLDGYVVSKQTMRTATNRPYVRLIVNDGVQDVLVLIWESDIGSQDSELFDVQRGIRAIVDYDRDRNSFTLHRNSIIKPLWTKRGWNNLQDGDIPEKATA